MGKGKSTCALFLDLSKAFDTIDHKILLRKLMQAYGIRGKQNSFFGSYLINRKQCTKVNNYSSNFQTNECGVPHGSVMGPLLFLIYVNDLPCTSSFQTTLFADDTSLHLSHKDIKTLQLNVENELDKVDTWMRSNRLSINYNKTAYMILNATRSQNCNFEISMNGLRIQQTDSSKYLGVIIDNKLSWKPQISSLCGKLSQACGVVCKIRHLGDMKILHLIYFSLFHSHLHHCIIDWGRTYKTVIQPVQVLQNRILKCMTFSKRTSSANNIFKLLKILKVSDLYQINLEKFMYKCRLLPISCPLLLITCFQNYTAHVIMAQDNKFQEIIIINVLELIMVKKMLQYVGPVPWGCISNNTKMLPLHMFSYRVKLRQLAG